MKRITQSEHEVLGKEGAANVNAALEAIEQGGGRARDLLKARPYGTGSNGHDRRRRPRHQDLEEWNGGWDNLVMALEEDR